MPSTCSLLMVTRGPGFPCPVTALRRRAETCVCPGEGSTVLAGPKSTFGHGAKGLFAFPNRGLKSPRRSDRGERGHIAGRRSPANVTKVPAGHGAYGAPRQLPHDADVGALDVLMRDGGVSRRNAQYRGQGITHLNRVRPEPIGHG